MKNLEKLREIMIERHLKASGIENPDILRAMRSMTPKVWK